MKPVPFRLAARALAGAALAAFSGGMSVAAETPARMAMVWNIQEQAPDALPVTIKPGQAAAKARLLPPALYVLDEPARLPDGMLLLDAGTELAALTGVERSACTMRVPPVAAQMKPASALWSRKNRYLCLRDGDGDGRFDSYIWLYSAMLSAFTGHWPLLPAEGRTAPVRYRAVAPATSRDAPWLYLVLLNDAAWVQKLKFGGVAANSVGPNGRIGYTAFVIDPKDPVSVKTLPVQFEAFGGLFEVTAKNSDGITVRTIKPIPPAPLTVSW